MKWFKMLWLSSKEREALREAEKPKDIHPAPLTEDQMEMLNGRPYRKILYSNRNLTVVMKDGSTLSKSNASVGEFQNVRDALSEKEIYNIFLPEDEPVKKQNAVETSTERQLVVDNLSILRRYDEFVIKGTDVFLKGVNLAMPAPVIASFIELHERLFSERNEKYADAYIEQINALKMFWLKLALNPLEQSREDLLVFIRANDVRITRNGNLILYRRIVSKKGADKDFVAFVTQSYYNLKRDDLDPRNFAIAKNMDGYILVDLETYVPNDDPNEAKPFCNLQQMYLELPTYDNNTFTAWHDNNVEIKLGGVYKIPDNKINLDNGICAAGGLHAAAVNYDYSGFGDLAVVVLVNPSKAITVPRGEIGKLRTTEMFVACVNDKPHGVHFDENALAAFDSEYHDKTLEELEEAAKNKSFQNLSVQDEVPAISLVDLSAIKDMLKGRVKQVV